QPADTGTTTVEVEVETGALVLTGSTPGDQHPNLDIVGPNGYYQHVAIPDDTDDPHVSEDLVPAVLSIAASDDGLQLAHTLVEVTAGEALRVHVNLVSTNEEFEPGVITADPAATPTYPNDGYAVERRVVEDQAFGEITVESQDDDAVFVVTG